MSRLQRSYLGYIDDSGSQADGLIWTALVLPFDLWTEYLGRWLSYRSNLFAKTGVPADWELHAAHWLAGRPTKHIKPGTQQGDVLNRLEAKGLPAILTQDKAQRRERSSWYELGLRTIGTFTDALVLTVHGAESAGVGKVNLYNELLCFLEETMFAEQGRVSLIVDGADIQNGSLRTSHRALEIKPRRVIEDPTFRGADDSQLLQMADFCAHAAHRNVVHDPNRDERFNEAYQTHLARLIVRPPDDKLVARAIRGLDYPAVHGRYCVNRWPALHPDL